MRIKLAPNPALHSHFLRRGTLSVSLSEKCEKRLSGKKALCRVMKYKGMVFGLLQAGCILFRCWPMAHWGVLADPAAEMSPARPAGRVPSALLLSASAHRANNRAPSDAISNWECLLQ